MSDAIDKMTCDDCNHCITEGTFCGFNAISCEIHGNILAFDNPYHSITPSNCKDFECYDWLKKAYEEKGVKENESDRLE